MECLNDVFPIIIYILLTILIVVLIILGIKLIKTLGKVDRVVDDVNNKVTKLDGVFNIIDSTADALSAVSDKVVNAVTTTITNLFSKKKKKEEDDNE
ncbi:MAG: hypothetical protein PHD10_03480 [Bacilli bacterium]|nr:hypothetical protein [Bacilli bacterium]MDD4608171.1 hypothetical protein [Bacilli bacterium]